MDNEYLCERRLKKLDPHLHQLFSNTAFVAYRMLERYSTFFPEYTDHAVTHSLQVIHFCDELITDSIEFMNASEIYVLLMSCYLHDSGMGIPKEDYDKICEQILKEQYEKQYRGENVTDTIRMYHQEFSAGFIRKYAPFFEIPGEKYIEAIVQVARGHRKVDIFNRDTYPIDDFFVENGDSVCLPYLASLIRLADELDIAADRNISFVYPDEGNIEFKRHRAIKKLDILEDKFVLEIQTDDKVILDAIYEEYNKLNKMVKECYEFINNNTKFTLKQKKVEIIRI